MVKGSFVDGCSTQTPSGEEMGYSDNANVNLPFPSRERSKRVFETPTETESKLSVVP
jgi:hypothetical protein